MTLTGVWGAFRFSPGAELDWVGCSCCPICQSDGLELREYIRLATASRDEEFAVPLPCSRTLASRREHYGGGTDTCTRFRVFAGYTLLRF